MNVRLTLLFKNIIKFKFWYIFCCILLICSICVVYFIVNTDVTDDSGNSSDVTDKSENFITSKRSVNVSHVLCVLVPYRDAFEELLEFVPHMSRFLNHQGIHFYITLMNQIDKYRFNRGSLFNAGFKIITKKHPNCDYVALHDVDLLPLNYEISYAYPGKAISHLSSPTLHPSYHYPSFIGGIVLMSKDTYIRINGLSNNYWGWGHEDDELYMRITDFRVPLVRPGKISTDYTNTFRHTHRLSRKRDLDRCSVQALNLFRRDSFSGLDNVKFSITSARFLTIDSYPFYLYNVNLTCNSWLTPWCLC